MDIMEITQLLDSVATIIVLLFWIMSSRRDYQATIAYYRRKEVALLNAFVSSTTGEKMDIKLPDEDDTPAIKQSPPRAA